ncbi:hypothetical protein V6N13_083850 [Hibiscus sabdariffa]
MSDNPSFPTLSATARSLGPGGRPPDCLSEVVLPQSLERTCLSGSHEDARISKKAKDNNPSLDCLNVSVSSKAGIPIDSVPDVAMAESRPAHEFSELQNRTEGSKEGLLSGTVSYANMAARHPTSPGNSKSSTGHDLSSENPKPSKNELYGPWMTVDTHRRRNIPYNNSNKTTAPKAQRNEVVMGSMFSALNVVEDVGVELPVLPESGTSIGEGHVVADVGNIESQVVLPRPKTLKSATYMQLNPPKKTKGLARNNDGKETGQPSVDQDVTIIAQETGGKLSKTRGSTSRTQREGLHRGFSLRKPAELPPRLQPSLHDWMSNLSQQLQTSSAKERTVADGTVTIPITNAGHDPPIESLDPNHTSISPREPVASGDGHETMEFLESQQKVSLVNWNSVCRPSSHGGLGLRQVHLQNDAFLMKMAFRLITQSTSLWVCFLRAKYKCTTRVPASLRSRNYSSIWKGSSLWKGMSMIWKEVSKRIIWRVGHGKDIDFWWDKWVPDVGALHLHVPSYQVCPTGVTVADMATGDGEWRWEAFQHMVPNFVLARIAAIKGPSR